MDDFFNDDRRQVPSVLVKMACGSPGTQAWTQWRKLVGVPAHCHYLTKLEAVLLVARSNWAEVKLRNGIRSRTSPSYTQLYKLGLEWFFETAKAPNTAQGLVFECDGDSGVEGRALVEVIRLVAGKLRSRGTIRSRCLKLGWGFSVNQVFTWNQVRTIADSL